MLYVNSYVHGDLVVEDDNQSSTSSLVSIYSGWNLAEVVCSDHTFVFKTLTGMKSSTDWYTVYYSSNRLDMVEEVARKIFGNIIPDGTYNVNFVFGRNEQYSSQTLIHASSTLEFSVLNNVITPIALGMIGGESESTWYIRVTSITVS